jgi:hypothetical protein
MGRSETDLVTELMLSEPTIAKLTEPAVARTLESFELKPRREMSWIARAVQGVLYASMRSADERPDRRSNAEIRDELSRLGSECSKLWLQLAERSSEADGAIWDRAFRDWIADTKDDLEAPELGEPTEYKAFNEAFHRLDWLAGYLKKVGAALERQPPNWRRAEQREQRIIRAQYLSPIYEEAFAAEPTINTWPTAKSLGPWADFYQRIVALAFGERATPNLEAVLDEARRRDKAHRVIFGPGVVPE